MGNDYGFLLPALGRLGGAWPRLRASVIVPVYNRRAILEKTLAALCSQDYPRALFEVIVADDGSDDRPEELLADYAGALDLRFVRQDDRGFRVAAVRNLAIRAARGEVIVGLDCDMLPMRGWLRTMLAPFHVYGGPLCVIGDRRNVDTAPLSAAAIRADVDAVARLPRAHAPAAVRLWWSPSLDWRVPIYWRTRNLRSHPTPFMVAAGGNLAYRKRDALAAGLHDESFAHWGGEDDEFAYRLYRQGAYFIPARRATAYHQAHEVRVPREAHRQETRQLLGRKVPHYRRFVADGSWHTPTVSVCIRARNAARTAARAIDSALAQTLPDLDVCVYDLGSADGTMAILERYVHDSRVRVLGPQPGGTSAAANAAARACTGDLLLCMDADEVLRPDAAARLADVLDEDARIAIAYGGREFVDTNGRFVGQELPDLYSASRHLWDNTLAGPRMIRARDLWRAGGWDESLDAAQDHDLTLRICERGLARPVKEVLSARAPLASRTAAEREHDRQWRLEVIRRALVRHGIPARVSPGRDDRPDALTVIVDEKALTPHRGLRAAWARALGHSRAISLPDPP